MSLVEALAASAILLVGLAGVLQGVITASHQNALAGRMARAGSVAQQVRAGLEVLGRARVNALFDTCSSAPDVLALAGGLEALPAAEAAVCVVDLDAHDDAPTAASPALVPGYLAENRQVFRRVLVRIRPVAAASTEQVAVVVSWRSLAQRQFLPLFIGLYDPALNGALVEI
ncbi:MULTISPECIES: prepilin cleavage protein [Myxococcaceae]|uniref:type IV pilus modification PilV family protein n=1 Tax=Myxococcaceae TaxID=31 RepID=UPI001E48E311|nr:MULTISPECIES: prepilin cleavage protein [Myxococcaceae]